MKKLFTTGTLLLVAASMSLAQTARYNAVNVVPMGMRQTTYTEPLTATNKAATPTNTATAMPESGSDNVTWLKIGEAVNAYTFVDLDNTQIAYTKAGTNDVLGFIFRQNTGTCGGDATQGGRYRYTLSTDGGTTWNVATDGTAITTATASSPAPANTCYGFFGPGATGGLNPTYTRIGRYPSLAMSGGASLSDLSLAYVGYALPPSGSTPWEGHVRGYVTNVETAAPTVSQEEYPAASLTRFGCYGLTERVPGEFWYVTYAFDPSAGTGTVNSEEFFVYRGIRNSTTNTIAWSEVANYVMDDNDQYTGTGASVNGVQIAFSPVTSADAANTGYISMIADLEGGTYDNLVSFSPVFIKIDMTSGSPVFGPIEEIELNQFQQLRNEYLTIESIDNTVSPPDTTFIDYLSTSFESDMVVDGNGTPHFFTNVVLRGTDVGFPDPSSYTILASGEIPKNMCDITKDSYGDWNILKIAPVKAFRGEFGTSSDALTYDNVIQASVSTDGKKVFAQWVDTDTTAYPATPALTGAGNMTNYKPNLIGFSYDIDVQKTTIDTNWTANDASWATKMLGPKSSPLAFNNGTAFVVPVVNMTLDLGDALQRCSFYYFSDIAYTPAMYTEDPEFLYNCKESPIAANLNLTSAACGGSNGTLAISLTGGSGPFGVEWFDVNGNAIGTGTSVSNQPAGIFTVVATDTMGCTFDTTFVLSNLNAPVASVDPNTIVAATCNGLANGQATVAATGGTGAYTYVWSQNATPITGATQAAATNLPAGLITVEVKDQNNCATYVSLTITEPDVIAVTGTQTNVKCNGAGDGTITVMATGGNGGFTYSFTDGTTTVTTNPATGLTPGVWTLTVSDSKSCTQTATWTITEPKVLSASNPPIVKNTNANPPYNGKVTVFGKDGTAPYTIRWFNCRHEEFLSASGGPLGQILDKVPADTFTVEITDANGCFFTKEYIVTGTLAIAADSLKYCNFVGVNDAAFRSFNLYPNPASTTLTLSMELVSRDNASVSIVGMDGKEVLHRAYTNATVVNDQFSIEGLAKGVYLVRVVTAQGVANEKLIIE